MQFQAQLLAHRISLGSFVLFNTYMGVLIWPMIALGWVVNLMQRGTACWLPLGWLSQSNSTFFHSAGASNDARRHLNAAEPKDV